MVVAASPLATDTPVAASSQPEIPAALETEQEDGESEKAEGGGEGEGEVARPPFKKTALGNWQLELWERVCKLAPSAGGSP